MLKKFFAIFCLFLFVHSLSSMAMSGASQKRTKGCVTHVVNVDESLLSVLKSYKVTYDQVREYNQALSKEVAVGDIIYIPKNLIGQSSPDEITLPWGDAVVEQPKKELHADKEIVHSPIYRDTIIHTIEQNQTLYSVSRLYGIPLSELMTLNPQAAQGAVYNGMEVKVAVKRAPKEYELTGEDTVDYRNRTFALNQSIRKITKQYSEPYVPIKVALMLPLEQNSRTNKGFVELYQGFLIGLDSLKKEGVSIDLNLIDTGRDMAKIGSILRSGALENCDIIVGPVYENQFCAVANYASQRQIPIVSPLLDVSCNHPTIFQVSPNSHSRYTKLKQYVENKKVILLKSPSDDQQFIDTITSMATDTLTILDFDIKKSAEDYLPWVSGDTTNLFLVAATSKADIERVISKVGAIKAIASGTKSSTLASYHAARYASTDPSTYFKADIRFVASYHADRSNKKVREFDNRYIRSFHTMPSLFSYRGYDIAMFFLGSMKEFGSDIYNYCEGYYTTILQVNYRFHQRDKYSAFKNNEWMVVHYRPNFEIEVE